MAKGQESKAIVMKKLMEVFDNAFLYNDGKELRVPMIENGEEVQIKIALTCAKDNVQPGDDNAIPGTVKIETKNETLSFKGEVSAKATESVPHVVPSEEEKANVKSMLEFLGLGQK